MKLRIALAVVSFFISVGSFAQSKMLTMKDAFNYKLYPSGVEQLQWADNDNYAYVDTNESGDRVWKMVTIDLTNINLVKMISTEDIDAALHRFEKDIDSLKSLPRGTWTSRQTFRFYHQKKYYEYHSGDKKISRLVDLDGVDMSHLDIHWKSKNFAHVESENLFVNKKQITTDGGNGIVYGQSVHRNEFGINGGMFWSEDGQKLAFYRMDESMVTEYPLYNLDVKPSTAKQIRYPVAGNPSHHVTLGVYDVKTGKTIYIKTGEPAEQYLTNISWNPNGKSVYIAIVNREQNHLWLNEYNVETGDFVKTLFEETNSKYVEPEHPMIFTKNPNEFVWWSERDGYNHLYLYNTEGKLLDQLTKGEWVVTQFHGFSDDGKFIYITCTKESPLNRDLYAVSVKNAKKMTKLTNNEGTHTISASPNNVHFIDNFSSTITPREVRILGEAGNIISVLKTAENPLKDYKLGQMEIGSIPSTDKSVELYYRVFKPINFDPSKKYPVIVYLYNGPHVQLVTNSWLGGANLWYQYLAEQGYVVFTIDGRGSDNRGFAFESAVHRQMATLEMDDQLAGVNWLKTQQWVDADRMGVHGWSYGGFMTTSLMTRKPGTFKVGVAGGPVINWEYYEIMYTERYMDSPQENPEGYKNNNLLNYADKIQGKLLMIHGGQDDVVLWQHSLLFMQKNIQSGNTNLDYFVYPHHPHNVSGPDRVHLYQKITDYLFENLSK
ncbi:MAG: DPP IV N-terminal domain-containing protein [Flavobacteriales bacterium]|nr:DPP IV N-terminal domain-containing protein [Flavobacteriales bacterium]